MRLGPPARMMLRMGGMVALAFLLCNSFPAPILRTLEPFTRVVTDWTSPYVENVHLSLQDRMIRVQCDVRLDMTRVDGSSLPMVSGFRDQGIWQTFHLVVMALAVFAAPAMPIRRRLAALPVTLVAVTVICAFQLSVEIQSHVLQTIGSSWLQTVQPAQTEANLAYFKSIQTGYDILLRLKSLNAGGGALFLAVLSGLAGYCIPTPGRHGRAVTQPTAG